MDTNYLKKLIVFFMKPLKVLSQKFGDNYEDIYNYFYYKIEGAINQIEAAIKGGTNLTIVGNAGQGKTCLMRYMELKLKKEPTLYPIFIDLKEKPYRDRKDALCEFCRRMREYYADYITNINEIRSYTNRNNADSHYEIIVSKLASTPIEQLSKRLVILLDDLDYADTEYYDILNTFKPLAASDKATFILSVRRPMWNYIQNHSELRDAYYLRPTEISMPNGHIHSILTTRVQSIISKRSNSWRYNFLNNRTKKLDKLIINTIRNTKLLPAEIKIRDISNFLDFKPEFWGCLERILYCNIRKIEKAIIEIIEWEETKQKPSFKESFYDAYIKAMYKDPLLLLNLVLPKTHKAKKKESGNSILQNVLEYFFYYEVANDYFYLKMQELGISHAEADEAIKQLLGENYELLEERTAYGIVNDTPQTNKFYYITMKGIEYVSTIFRKQEYYEKIGQSKSNRSFYEEYQKVKHP